MKARADKVSFLVLPDGFYITARTRACADEVQALPDGDYDITITKHREKRSLNANAYFHLLVNKIAEVTGQSNDDVKIRLNMDYGTIATQEERIITVTIPAEANIKQFYDYAQWVKDSPDGKFSVYILYKQTHTLNSKEFARLIDGAQVEAKELGIETLDEIDLKRLINEIDNPEGK